MNIYTLACLAAYRLPWYVHTAIVLALVMLAARVARYVWLNLVHVVIVDLVALRGQWQQEQDEAAKRRRLNELAIVETRRKVITAIRQELVSKWAGSEVEVEVIN